MARKTFKTALVVTGDSKGATKALTNANSALTKFDISTLKAKKRQAQYQRSLKKTSSYLKGLAGAAVAAGGAVIAGAVFSDAMRNHEDLQRNLLRTTQLIKSTGATAGFSAEQLHEQAKALAMGTLQNTKSVMQAQQVMLSFRKVTGDTFTRAIALAADLATVTGGSLKSAVTQLGKALEDPVRGITALSRSGVSFSESQQDTIRTLVETNDVMGAQNIILDELARQYENVAQAEAQGLAGAIDTRAQTYEELTIALDSYLGLSELSKIANLQLSDSFVTLKNSLELSGDVSVLVGLLEKYDDTAVLLAKSVGVGLATAIGVKATAAMYGFATANGVASLSMLKLQAQAVALAFAMHGKSAAIVIATTATTALIGKTKALTIAMMKNPITLGLVATAGAIAYFALRTDEATNSTTKLTEALSEQGIVLDELTAKLRTKELAEYEKQLASLESKAMRVKKFSGGFFSDAEDKAEDLEKIKRLMVEITIVKGKITNLFSGKAADYDEAFDFDKIAAVFAKLDTSHKTLMKNREDAENAYLDLALNNAITAQQAMVKAWDSSYKERLKLQNQLNKLVLSESEQRALVLGSLHDENRALQQKVWYIEDAKKAKQDELKVQAELNKLMDAELDIAIKQQETMAKAWGQDKSDNYDRLLKNQLFDDNLAFDKLDAQDLLLEQTLDMVNAVDSYGDAWTRTGNKALDALGSMANVLGQVHSSDTQYTEQLIKLKNQGLDQTSEYIKLEEARAKNSIHGSVQMLKASSTMFEEGSKAQKVAHTASMVYHAIQLKMDIAQAISAATVAVATQGKGDPFTAWVRIGAMSAMMAGLLSQIGAGFSGSSGASAAVAIQPKTGSGALGGGESNSIENALDYMDTIQADQYSELRGIHQQTKLLNQSIGNAVAGLFRTDELHNMGTGYSSFKQSALASFTSNIPLIGNAVSSALSSVFGGGRRSHQSGYGIDFDGTMGSKDLDAYSVTNHHRKGGWFRKSRNWSTTSYSDLQAENESSIGLIFESMSKQAVKLGNALDMNVANQVANTDIIIGKISMAGSADDVQKRMLQAMNKQSDHLIGTVFGEVIAGYQQMGEGLAETLNRLVTNKIVVEDIISMTSQTVRGDVIALSDSLVTLAGGLTNLQDISESYFDNFHTDAEKIARNKMLLTTALSEQSLALSDSRAGYRIMLESLDLGTKKGLEQYHTLLKMNEQADKHFDILEKRQEELQQAELKRQEELHNFQMDSISDIISKLKGLSDALNSTFDSILGSVTTDAQSYMQAQSTIFNALSEAQNGNLPELDDLKKSLSVLSSNDINRYASAEDFNRDQKLTANAVLELKTLVGSEISYEDRSLALLEAIKGGVTLENGSLISAISSGFNILDTNRDMNIDFSEFKSYFSDFATATEMQAMFNGLDLNNDGNISAIETAIKALSSDFNSIDFNQDNLIDYEEFSKTFSHLASATEMQAMFNGLDVDGSGAISQLEASNASLLRINSNTHVGNVINNNLVSAVGNVINNNPVNAVADNATPTLINSQALIALYNSPYLWDFADYHGMSDDELLNYLSLGGKIPEFAKGGVHTGGLRIVGEKGAELEYTPPSRIFNHSQTNKMLDNSELLAEIKALNKEISLLRQGNNSANSTMITKLRDIRGHLQTMEMVSLDAGATQ